MIRAFNLKFPTGVSPYVCPDFPEDEDESEAAEPVEQQQDIVEIDLDPSNSSMLLDLLQESRNTEFENLLNSDLDEDAEHAEVEEGLSNSYLDVPRTTSTAHSISNVVIESYQMRMKTRTSCCCHILQLVVKDGMNALEVAFITLINLLLMSN